MRNFDVKVKKYTARKMFDAGYTIVLVPCKCGVDNIVCRAEITKSDNCRHFNNAVDSFEYYNCRRETGTYSHYYVVSEDYEEFIKNATR